MSLRRPCSHCPFRTDVHPYLAPARVADILNALTRQDATFSCHQTNEFDDAGDAIETPDSQHCAGALILLEKIGRPNQLMRIYERLGVYDRTRLDMGSPVYDTPDDMLRAAQLEGLN